jgi:hypothetical protein
MKECELGGACDTYGREEKYILDIASKTKMKMGELILDASYRKLMGGLGMDSCGPEPQGQA